MSQLKKRIKVIVMQEEILTMTYASSYGHLNLDQAKKTNHKVPENKILALQINYKTWTRNFRTRMYRMWNQNCIMQIV